LAKSTILDKWEELFGAEGEPSGMPTEVAGLNSDTESTTRLVNSSLSPFRNFASAFDDGWTATKPMPLRATQSEEGGPATINHGDIALLWSMVVAGSNAVAGLDDVGSVLNGVAPLDMGTLAAASESSGHSSAANKKTALMSKFDSKGALAGRVFGADKVVAGKYRLSNSASISEWDTYTMAAMNNPRAVQPGDEEGYSGTDNPHE